MAGVRGWRKVVQQQMEFYRFTRAEQRVAWTLFDFQTNRDVGEALGASPQTIKNQITKMLSKTRTRNRLELVLVLLRLPDEELPSDDRLGPTRRQARRPLHSTTLPNDSILSLRDANDSATGP